MRYLFTLLLAVILCTSVRAQVGVRVDGEYVEWCMVDVLAPDNVISFTRVLSMATKEVIDIGTDGSTYLVVGNPKTCEAYQLDQAGSDPVEELYSDCQCRYTIRQEGNKVIDITGGSTQEYTVQYNNIVERQCDGQSSPTEVFRDTLTRTAAIPDNRAGYGFQFSQPGEYVEEFTVRKYLNGLTQLVVIDLDPATAATTYQFIPGGVNTSSLTYNGSNSADMRAEYERIIAYALSGPDPVNNLHVTQTGSTIGVSFSLQDDPERPYTILPWTNDSDLNVQTTIQNNPPFTLSLTAGGLQTRSNNYIEECEQIWITNSAIYLGWDPNAPLSISPVIGPNVSMVGGLNSNASAFCDADPAFCAALATGQVELAGCVSICDTVEVVIVGPDTLSVEVVSADTLPVQVVAMPIDTCGASTQSHQQFSGTSGTLTADTYASVAITVTSGTVAVTIDGTTINYPTGFAAHWTATNLCDRLTESFTIDAANGSAIITTLQ